MLTIFLISFAVHAEETNALLAKDVFFQPGGGIRVRYLDLNQGTGGAFDKEEGQSSVTHRFQFDMQLHKGEYFQSFARFIHVDQWGRASSATGDTNPGLRDSFEKNNGLFVNQAWGLWKVADSLGFKFGRSPIVLGRGFTYGENDWFDLPYTFDHFDVIWDWESFELSLIAAKVQELEDVAAQSVNPDPEENHIIVDANVKGVSDYINTLNIHFAQITKDIGSNDGGANLQNGLSIQRFGFDIGFSARQFFGGIFASYVTGEERSVAGASITQTQYALETELGYLIPSWNDLRFWGGYHIDSGDGDSSDNNNESYDSFYYDVYGRTGKMDFLRWGNLTAAKIGFDIKVTSQWTVGSEFFRFSKTNEADTTINFGDAGSFMSAKINSGDIAFNSSAKGLGDEFDFWVNYELPSGIMINATLATFFPGDVFSQALTTSGSSAESQIFQFISQISIFF